MTKLIDLCPKCSCHMLSGNLQEHIKNCDSTIVADGAKNISDRIDKMILEEIGCER